MLRRILGCCALVLLVTTAPGARFQPSTGVGLSAVGPQPQASSEVDIMWDFSRWPWPLYEEVAARLRQLATRYPTLAQVYSIGKTGGGRDLWVLEINNSTTGPGDTKPGLWMDGNIHAGELWSREGLSYIAAKWLANYGQDPRVTHLLDTRTFYILPMFDADGGERVLTRHPAWPGYKTEEQSGRDVDGDGHITQMRVRDPTGTSYPSRIDPRVMLSLRDRSGGRNTFVPTTWEDPETSEPLAAPDQRYRLYTEGASLEAEPVSIERERTNFNRHWSAEWKPEERGAGPYPFLLPEVRAVTEFMTSRKNFFFQYTIHGGGGARNYQVRPRTSHPFEDLEPEDNDFHTRVGAMWSCFSHGGVMNNNYYRTEVTASRYGDTMTGFANHWAFLHLRTHALLQEAYDSGRDYDDDGYVTIYEVLRWSDEEHGGKFFAPWQPYNHQVLGEVEIGGPRAIPTGLADRLKEECDTHFRLLTSSPRSRLCSASRR